MTATEVEETKSAAAAALGLDEQAPETAPSSWGHRPALDGLRAVAVYLVLAFHADVSDLAGGFVGVDLFFVLSGFVVTNVIWSELSSTGSLRLRRFYARRMRRLTPAAIALVIGASMAFVLMVSLPERLGLVADARAALLYFANWHFLAESTDYFASAEAPSPFLHFWSLSIEEQFYAIFPLVLLSLFALARKFARPAIVPIGIGLLAAASVVSQWYWSSRDAAWAYYGTDARLYQLLAGCLLALLLREWVRVRDRSGFGILAALALAGLLAAALTSFDVSASARGFVAAGCSVAIILGLEHSTRGTLTRALSGRTITYLGAISYGIYLWHWPVILLLERVLEIQPWTMFVVASVLSTGLAALSNQILEQPIRRAKALDRFPRTVIVGGLAITLVVALVVTPRILESSRTPRLVRNDAAPVVLPPSDSLPAGFDDPVPGDIDYEAIRSFRVDLPDCYVSDLDECTVREGANEHVLVIGDSIAQQFIPAFEELAEENDWTLSLNVWGACTWQMGVAPRPDIAESNAAACRDRRSDWYPTAIEALEPDVVVAVSLLRDDPERWAGLIVGEDPSIAQSPPSEVVAATTRSTLDFLGEFDLDVILIEPPPIAPDFAGPTVCLASARTIGECSFELEPPSPTEYVYRAEATGRPDVHTVDVDPLICPDDPICMPIIDGTPVWRDDGHLSHFFVDDLTPDLGELLVQSGAFDDQP